MADVSLGLGRGECTPGCTPPADPPATNIAVPGPRGPGGRIIPLACECRDSTIVTVVDDRGMVTGRARRPKDLRVHDPWTKDRLRASSPSYGTDYRKSFAVLIRELTTRPIEDYRQNP